MPLGEMKQIMRQLQFIHSIRFMVSSLDSLSRNLAGENGMVCKECRSEAELMQINENYVTHGTCGKCQAVSHQKLGTDLIFDNLRVGHTGEQFPEKEFIPTNTWKTGKSSKRTPRSKLSTEN